MAVLGRLLATGPARFTPGQLSVVRFGVGAAASLAVFAVRPSLYRPRNVRLLVTRGISGGLVVVLYFAALARIPAGEAGMIYNLFPAIATVLALGLLGERPGLRLWLAIGDRHPGRRARARERLPPPGAGLGRGGGARWRRSSPR